MSITNMNYAKDQFRAGAHGLASGVFNALDGGSFGSGFISGAAASGIGSLAQGVNMNPGLMVLSTSSMGGFAAWVTGGDFVSGALQGLQIGMLNHVMHGDGKRHYTPNGNYYTIDDDGIGEVYVIGRSSISKARNFPTDALFVATAINTAGTIVSQDVRIGTNGIIYFRHPNGNIFYSNKYVKTNVIKSAIPAKYAKFAGIYLNVLSQAPDVINSYNTYGAQSHEFQRSVAVACGSVVGCEIGTFYGGKITGIAFSSVAACFSYGTAVGPAYVGGEIVGSIAGGYMGASLGGWLMGTMYDYGF